jgi:hypothetical protein
LLPENCRLFWWQLLTKIKKMNKIFLVIEQGAGIIHMAFQNEKDASDHAKELQKITGWDCYEVQSVNFQPTKLVTIQELIDNKELAD